MGMTTATAPRVAPTAALPDRRHRTTFQVRVGTPYGLSPETHHQMLLEATSHSVTLSTLLEAMWKAYRDSPQRAELANEAAELVARRVESMVAA